MSLTSYRAAPPRVNRLICRGSCSKPPSKREVQRARFSSYCHEGSRQNVMHGNLEAGMGDNIALQPRTPIGPAVRAIAAGILATARRAIADPELSNQDAVHAFRRAMKQWRALMRLLEPLIPGRGALAARGARSRSIAGARARRRGGAGWHSMAYSTKASWCSRHGSGDTIRSQLEALRGSEEQAVLTPGLRDAIFGVARYGGGRGRAMAARSVRFFFDRSTTHQSLPHRAPSNSGALDKQPAPPNCIRCASASSTCAITWNWSNRCGRASAACGPTKRNACAAKLGQCQDLEVLKRLTEPHQPLAHWRSRLTPACAERSGCIGTARGPHRQSSVRRAPEGVPPAPRNAVGERALARRIGRLHAEIDRLYLFIALEFGRRALQSDATSCST